MFCGSLDRFICFVFFFFVSFVGMYFRFWVLVYIVFLGGGFVFLVIEYVLYTSMALGVLYSFWFFVFMTLSDRDYVVLLYFVGEEVIVDCSEDRVKVLRFCVIFLIRLIFLG